MEDIALVHLTTYFCIFLYPQIDMDFIRQYQSGRDVPQVKLMIEKVGEGKPTKHYIIVELRGVLSPRSFMLLCTHNTTTTGWLYFVYNYKTLVIMGRPMR